MEVRVLLGYVKAFKPEMKIKDYELYRGIYCSLCRALGKNYSPLAQLFLSYDFALAAVFFLAVRDDGCSFSKKRCPYNPSKKCMICASRDVFDFCSHAVIITVYYKLLDNLHDKEIGAKLLAALLFPIVSLMHRKAAKKAPEIEEAEAFLYRKQAETESEKSVSIDKSAHPSADTLGKIFALGANEKSNPDYYRFGYMIGRFVYITDAADDLERDKKTGNFNPFANEKISSEEERRVFAEKVDSMLSLTHATALETLDAIKVRRFYGILDNVIFEGLDHCRKTVLSKYLVQDKKCKNYRVN